MQKCVEKKMFYNIIFCPKNLVGNKICSTFALAIGKQTDCKTKENIEMMR